MQASTIRNWSESLAAGAIGAVTLTTVHEVARRLTDDAPRMDVVAERGIATAVEYTGGTPPPEPRLHRFALAGDLLANSAYYSLVTCGRRAHVWRRGVALGLAAGVGALLLPGPLGLGDPPKSDRLANQVMTVAWYLIGGLAAAAAGESLRGRALPG